MKATTTATFALTRQIPIEEGYDVLVAGGGPAGASAAICAARLGAKVLLVEQMGCMGGMGTSGLVTAWDPMANGQRMLVGGLMKEIVETMYTRGMLEPGIDPNSWLKLDHHWTPFSAEGLKLLLDELATAAGVEVRFFTRVIDADVAGDKSVRGVILQNIEGYRYIRAKAYIDCTGNAELTNACGAAVREAGRDTKRIMPATLASLHAGIDWERFDRSGHWRAHAQAIAEGKFFTQKDRHMPGMSRAGAHLGYLNGGHVFNLNALNCRSLSYGMMLGRRIVREFVEFFHSLPGCESMEVVAKGALMGVRESRRIVGEYELSISDYLARRQFPDQIGVFNKFVDIHPYDCSEEEHQRFLQEKDKTARLKPGECFGIPYSILVPKGWRNLWVAGRCNSSDVMVHGSIRVMPAASMMGQAAGTAAVQAIREKQIACELDTAMLVQTLRKGDAYLPQTTLAKEMTRA